VRIRKRSPQGDRRCHHTSTTEAAWPAGRKHNCDPRLAQPCRGSTAESHPNVTCSAPTWARLVSICSGIFVLAATGLLNGRPATTHWKYVSQLGEAFPNIELRPDVLYVDDGDIMTSAGSAAGIDLCLHIIRRDMGTLVANQVARRLVVSPHREGGQTQFIERPVGMQERPWLSELLEWIQGRLEDSITVDQLAQQSGMSKRTLTRRFADATGSSPLDWITSLRIQRAKDLLETTALSIEEIADGCGFGSAPTLRHHFRLRVKLTPTTYRARFRRTDLSQTSRLPSSRRAPSSIPR